jgi:hypothetical protein
METEIRNETEKILISEEGKVLTNGGEFEIYPTNLIVNINDNTWYEIDKPIEVSEQNQEYPTNLNLF